MQHKFFRLAEREAFKSEHRIKIGAVLVHKGQVINVGHNRVGHTHPRYNWYLHAEMDACLGLDRRNLTNAVIYLFRINRLGAVFNCRPCTTCQTVLKELGIKSVCYTTGNKCVFFPDRTDGTVYIEQTYEPHYHEMRL